MKTYLHTTSLGIIALGLLGGGIVACGDEGAQSTNEPATDETTATIVARGIAVGGCGANGVFDIFTSANNSTSNTDFIALDQSDFTNLTSQLSSFNSQNQQTLVSNNADTLDSLLQVAINEATSNTSAFQESEAATRSAAHTDSSTSVARTVSHSDSSVATTDSSSRQWSRNSGSASNRALSENQASSNRRADQNARSANNFNNSRSFVGGAVSAPRFGLGISTPISSVFSNNSAFNDTSVSSSLSAFTNNFDLVASENSTSFANFAASSQEQHTAVASANEWTRSIRSNTNDSADRFAESKTAQNSRQDASQRSFNKNVVNSERSTHVAFKNLQDLQSKQFVLNVNVTASDNRTHTLRVFEGNNNNITSRRNFSISFPNCGFIDP